MGLHGNGHIKQLYDGRYFIQVTLGSRNGKQIRKSKICSTKAEAIAFRTEQQRLAARQQLVNHSSMKFGGWLDKYMRDYIVDTKKPTTVEHYYKIVAQIKKHRISNIRLQKLTRRHIQDFINELSSHIAPSSVICAYSLIKTSLRYAEIEELITVSPCRNIILPALKPARTVTLLTEEQEKTFLAAIENHPYKCLFLLGLMGLRCSEVVGLQVEDVDLEMKTIIIRHQYISYEHGPELHDYTKTNRPRTLPIDDTLAELLKNHIDGRTSGHLFLTKRHPHKPLTSRGYVSAFKNVLKKANLPPVNIHSLRHLCASKLMRINPRIAADWLGHTTVRMTLDRYSHSNLEDLTQALNTLAN